MINLNDKKKCSICNEEKIIKDNFGLRNRKMNDGSRKKYVSIYCKQCVTYAHRVNRSKNLEKTKEKDKIYNASERAKKSKNTYATKKKNERLKTENKEIKIWDDKKYVRIIKAITKNINKKVNKKQSIKNILFILGYTEKELFNYLSLQFNERLNLENFASNWRLYHRNKNLQYTSIEDENFKLYWKLDNLQVREINQLDGLKICNICGVEKNVKNNFKIYGEKPHLTSSHYCNDCDRVKKKNKRNDIHNSLRRGISVEILKKLKSKKNKKSILNHLDYTIQELKNHIEEQFKLPENYWMNWNNRGVYCKSKWNDNDPSTWRWQIDHIIPHSKFKYISMEDQLFKDCWSLSNLRPYSAKQNIIDGASRIRHKTKCE